VNLLIEKNPRNCLDIQLQLTSGAVLMITAPAITDCWLFRVPVTEDLALFAVPEFGGVSITLSSAGSCYASVPYETRALQIMRIFRARLAKPIPRGRCLQAIKMLKVAVQKWRGDPVCPK
jgi:hypothetical protein